MTKGEKIELRMNCINAALKRVCMDRIPQEANVIAEAEKIYNWIVDEKKSKPKRK